MRNKRISAFLIACILCSSVGFTACSTEPKKATRNYADNILRVASWDEYIDMGEDDAHPLYEDFEDWYFNKRANPSPLNTLPCKTTKQCITN